MSKSKDYKVGFADGRREEAKVTLSNLTAIKEELDSVGYTKGNSYIDTCIKELENFLK